MLSLRSLDISLYHLGLQISSLHVYSWTFKWDYIHDFIGAFTFFTSLCLLHNWIFEEWSEFTLNNPIYWHLKSLLHKKIVCQFWYMLLYCIYLFLFDRVVRNFTFPSWFSRKTLNQVLLMYIIHIHVIFVKLISFRLTWPLEC